MHFVPGGYVGLCRLSGEEVNVCGLFRMKSKSPDLSSEWAKWLRGPEGSILFSRLSHAEFAEDSCCATAGFSLRPRSASEVAEVRIGDSLTMIPPLTGNGMSMAFESAEIALDPMAQFSQGSIEWMEAKRRIAQGCDQRFVRRLRWAAKLHPYLFHPIPQSSLLFLVARSEGVWKQLYSLTR
jgi:flavin-dependent dehydrogenase